MEEVEGVTSEGRLQAVDAAEAAAAEAAAVDAAEAAAAEAAAGEGESPDREP